MVLVLGDSAGAAACRQFTGQIRSKGWTEAHVQEGGEAPPRWNAFVLLKPHVPLLRWPMKMECRQPDLSFFEGTLTSEVMCTAIEERQGIARAVERWEIQLVPLCAAEGSLGRGR